MKKNYLLILILIILIIVVCLIVFLVKNLNKPTPTTVSNCIEAGNEFLNPGGQQIGECCEDLSEISEIKDKEGYSTCEEAKENTVGWGSICSACGNGVCENWEGVCNCPGDCETNCHKTGEVFSTMPLPGGGQDTRPCCGSLKIIYGTDIAVCTNCGNKVCDNFESGLKEDKSNCPEDCEETLNCHKEGEIFSRAPLPSGGQDLRPCCSGLTDITGTDISVCINCGDKICKDYGFGFDEKDFCPEDCELQIE